MKKKISGHFLFCLMAVGMFSITSAYSKSLFARIGTFNLDTTATSAFNTAYCPSNRKNFMTKCKAAGGDSKRTVRYDEKDMLKCYHSGRKRVPLAKLNPPVVTNAERKGWSRSRLLGEKITDYSCFYKR